MVLGHIFVHRDAADFFCSALPAHIARPIPHRSSQFSRPAVFCRLFSWALLQANSCARQLRGFCFPGSALTPPPPQCDLNHRLAISEASVGRSSACKSCKSELRQSARSDVWSIGWPGLAERVEKLSRVRVLEAIRKKLPGVLSRPDYDLVFQRSDP